MKKLNPEYVASMRQLANSSPYFQLLSMQLCDIDVGSSHLEIDVTTQHLHALGQVHGGVCASIIDAAAFWAGYSAVQDEKAGATSVDLKLNYLAPAESGKLIAKGRLIRLGRTLAYAEAG